MRDSRAGDQLGLGENLFGWNELRFSALICTDTALDLDRPIGLDFGDAAIAQRFKQRVGQARSLLRGKQTSIPFKRLLELADELGRGAYHPGPYRRFQIREPKRRTISAAPFRDRVVDHALCNVIEPRFERAFIPTCFANRVNKGTHRALDTLQACAREYRYALRLDIVKHFPSIDHRILLAALRRKIPEDDVLALIERILASGEEAEEPAPRFAGDDLLAACRPRGLPIGNLTSQFWSNCHLHRFDCFVLRELRCPAYLRYVDDFVLFSDSKSTLWSWKRAIIDRLARLRLVVHEAQAQVVPVEQGIPWLGFVVYPTHRRVKARKVREATRRLSERLDAYQAGRISFGEFDASVHGWINHVRYADTWGLRRHMLGKLAFRRQQAKG